MMVNSSSISGTCFGVWIYRIVSLVVNIKWSYIFTFVIFDIVFFLFSIVLKNGLVINVTYARYK